MKKKVKCSTDLLFLTRALEGKNADFSGLSGRFLRAYRNNRNLTLKWMFFIRDPRGGLGIRNFFRFGLGLIAKVDPDTANRIIPLIPEYGRWDDMWELLSNRSTVDTVVDTVANQLMVDTMSAYKGGSVSYVAKWMPSINASSAETRKNARILQKGLRLSEKEYRKRVVALRSCINIVERQMSEGKWSEINYNTVSRRANVLYNRSFLNHDFYGREKYLSNTTGSHKKCISVSEFCKRMDCTEPTEYLFGILNSERYAPVVA